MTDAICAHGTLLQMGAPLTTIAEVLDIDGPGMRLSTHEATSHDSAGWREYIGCVLEGGEVTFIVNFDPADATHDPATGLISVMLSGALEAFGITFTDTGATDWTFDALVTDCKPAEPVDGKLTMAVTLLITGEIDFAPV